MSPSAVRAHASRSILGRSLHTLRRNANRSAVEVADVAGLSKATWARVENGASPISSAVVQQVCEFLGVTDTQLVDRLRELASQTKARDGWLASYDSAVSENFRQFIGLEATANAIYSYEPEFIPGLLQTPGYMRGLIGGDVRLDPSTADTKVAQRQEIRQIRQRLALEGTEPTRLSVVIGGTGATRPYGGPEAMAEQIDHLLTIGRQPNIEIRVLPSDRVSDGAGKGQFILLDYPPVVANQHTLPSTVYIDGPLGFFLSDKPYDVETFRMAWDSLLLEALDPEETRQFLIEQKARLR